MNKINIFGILKDHWASLRSYKASKVSASDVLTMFGLPVIIAVVTVIFIGNPNDLAIQVTATAIAVFAALLFNLLLLVTEFMFRYDQSKSAHRRRGQFIREIHANISFAIVLSLVTLLLVIVYAILSPECLTADIMAGLIYYLLTVFTLTLLMILKRIHALIITENNNGSS